MRRVLLVHYHFLPVHNVAVKHLLGLARHLPECGWEPLVLTHHWTSIRPGDAPWGLAWEPERLASAAMPIHRVAEGTRSRLRRGASDDPGIVRKALTFAHMVAGRYPDDFTSWIAPAVSYACDLARRERIDLVLAYCPPESNLIVGSRIARRLHLPFVPYFGDLYGFLLAPTERRDPGAILSRAYHRHWMAPATAAAAVSPDMASYVEGTFGVPTSQVLVGFDPREFEHGLGNSSVEAAPPPGATAGPRRQRFVLSHVGSIYPGNQRPEIFLDGLDRFLRRRPDVTGRFVARLVGSKCDDTLRQMVAGRPSADVMQVIARVPSNEAVTMVRESDALLAFNCTAFRDRHGTLSYPSKIFEAFGARRPLLAIPPDEDFVDALLQQTRGGTSAATGEEVASVLSAWFDAWERTGTVPYDADDGLVASFTHERQAAELARLLDRATARDASSIAR